MLKGQTILWLLSLGFGLSFSLDICEHQLNGTRLLHPADCNKFVKCQNGKTDEIKSCPLGLHFNRFMSVCDLPQRAACDVAFMNFTTSENTDCSACCIIYGCYVKPECPETPGTTAYPTNPDCPETTTPSTPVTPDTAETPGEPETPVTTENIATSESSTTSESPVPPQNSTTPDSPTTHESTGTSETSDIPGTPAIPETPSTPETPVTPENPTTTANPDTPESPTTQESTGTSETSDTSGTPAIPETPSTQETPVTSENPTTTESPDTPESKTTTATPATPAIPSTLPTPATPAPENGNNCTNNLRVCIGRPDGSISLVNGTCNQYIVCVGGCATIMSCPNNLQYNITTQLCDYPENVDCPWQSTPPVTGPSGVTCAHAGKCANQSDGELFVDPNSNGYIVCQCECEIERPCPAGTQFDQELLTCILANGSGNGIGDANGSNVGNGNGNGNDSENVNAICSNDVQICKNQTEGTLFPVDGVCNKFYKCNFGCAAEIICPNNLIYNPRKEYCDYPQNYKCPWPYTSPSGPTAGPSGIACASGGRCVGQPEGTLFSSLNSCAKYVVCQCECEVEMDCSGNLLWDNNLLACNYPSKVTLSFALNDAY